MGLSPGTQRCAQCLVFQRVDPELKFIRSACVESRRSSVLAAFVKLRIPLFFCKDCVENPQHCGRLALKVEGGFLERHESWTPGPF